MRSCWECNMAHEDLKDSDTVIMCFACGNYYYKGINLMEDEAILEKQEVTNKDGKAVEMDYKCPVHGTKMKDLHMEMAKFLFNKKAKAKKEVAKK